MIRQLVLSMGVLLLAASSHVAWGSPSVAWSGLQDVKIGAGGGGVPDWPNPSPTTFWLDMNGNGLDDFYLEYLGPQNTGFFIDPLDQLNGTLVRKEGITRNPWPLPSGTLIDSTPADDTPWDSEWDNRSKELVAWTDVGPAGTWNGVVNGLLGVRFTADDGIHYGWIRITNPLDYPGAIIHDWAYETQPGVGIMAGVVPEPSTWALFLCGIACLLGRFSFQPRKSS